MTEVNYNRNRSLMGEENRPNLSNLNMRMNREISESFANDKKIINKIYESRERCYEECLQNIKDNYEEFYNKINSLYNEYYGTQNQNYIQIKNGDNRELNLYKNFIRVMVLGLNKSDVRLLVETVYNNDLSLDSFYSYFKEDIELSSNVYGIFKKNIKYDLNIENISDRDPRLKDHIYIFYFYFSSSFKSLWLNNTLLNIDKMKNKIVIEKDIKNNKFILRENISGNNLSINLYALYNMYCKNILNYNNSNILYYDIFNFFKLLLKNENLYEIYYIDLINYLLIYFGENESTTLSSSEKEAYLLGDRDGREAQRIRKNTFFYKDIFSYGKLNILSTYQLEFRKLNLNKNKKDIDYELNIIISYFFDTMQRFNAQLQQLIKENKKKNTRIIFNRFFESPQDENYTKITFSNNRKSDEYYRQNPDFFKNVLIDFQNHFYGSFINEFKNTNYIEYLLNSKIKLIDNTYYFNLSQYPVLFTIEDSQFSEFDTLKKEGKIKKSFYPLIDIIENPENFKKNNKKLVLCILNFYNSQLNSNSINQYFEIENNNQNSLLNTYTTNNSRNIDNKVNFIIKDIFYILRAQFSIFDICKFFYYFNKLVEIKNEKYLSKSINNILFEKVQEEKNKYSILRNKELNSSRTRLARINRYLASIFAMLNKAPTNMEKVTENNVMKVYNYMNKEIKNLEEKYKKLWIKKKELLKNINDMKKARNIIKTKEYNFVNEKGNPMTIKGLNGLLSEKKKLEKEYNNLVKGIQSKEELGDIKQKYRIQQLNELNNIVSLPEIIEMIYVIKEVKQREVIVQKPTNKKPLYNSRRPLVANYNSNSNGGPREPINV